VRIAENLLEAAKQRAKSLELDTALYLRTLLRNAELPAKPSAVRLPRLEPTKRKKRRTFTVKLPEWEYERIQKRVGPRQFGRHLEALIIADLASGGGLTIHPRNHPPAAAAAPDANNG